MQIGVNHEVHTAEALQVADEVEKQIGEIVAGKRKPTQISVQDIATLVQYVRDQHKRETGQ